MIKKGTLLFYVTHALMLLFIPGVVLFAAPPTSPYTPGETTDPTCSQGDANCTVAFEVNDLSDTTIASLTDADILIYDGSDSFDNKAISGDATIANTGALTIAANAVALSTDTTGDFVAAITGGSGISSTGATSGENISHTLSLGALTADWDQTGAFDLVLDNASSELKIADSDASHYGIFDVTDITSADKTYTFPNTSGTVALTSDLISDGTTPNSALRWTGSAWVETAATQLTTTGILQRPYGQGAGETSDISFMELTANGSNFINIKAPDAVTATIDLVLPDGDGDSGQYLKTDGSGVLSWDTPSGGSGGEFTDTGSILHPNEETVDEVAIGGTTEVGADIFLGVDGTALFNEQSNSVDFRVEGNGDANLFFVDGSEDAIAIGSPSGDQKLSIRDSSTGGTQIAKFSATGSDSTKDGLGISLHHTSDLTSTNQFLIFFKSGSTEIGSVGGDGAGGVAFNTSSDGRLKENISDTGYGLSDLLKIRTRDFNFIGSKMKTTGFIAQELLDIYPEVVSEAEEENKKQGLEPGDEGYQYMQVAYGKLTPLLVQAIQDLHQMLVEFKEQRAERIETKELCLEDVCITKSELQELLEIKEELLNN